MFKVPTSKICKDTGIHYSRVTATPSWTKVKNHQGHNSTSVYKKNNYHEEAWSPSTYKHTYKQIKTLMNVWGLWARLLPERLEYWSRSRGVTMERYQGSSGSTTKQRGVVAGIPVQQGVAGGWRPYRLHFLIAAGSTHMYTSVWD